MFSFLNVRKRALCFAGDVGSISIAAIILFLFKLVIHTNDFFYIFLLLIYALDSGATVLRRMVKGENIFKPHKEHLYQQLVHKKGWSHLHVSFIFSFVQLLVNVSIVCNQNMSLGFFTTIFVMFLIFLQFIVFKRVKNKLLNLPRFYKQLIMLIVDELVLLFAIWFSFALRLGEIWPIEYMQANWWLFVMIPAIAIPLFIKLGLYRAVLQYMGIKVFTSSF